MTAESQQNPLFHLQGTQVAQDLKKKKKVKNYKYICTLTYIHTQHTQAKKKKLTKIHESGDIQKML